MKRLSDIEDLSKVFYEKSHTLGQTIQVIKEMLNNPRELYFAKKLSDEILFEVPDRVFELEIEAIHKYITEKARYTRDIEGMETVKSIEVMYREIKEKGKFIGDCDDISLLLAGMLKAVGYKVRLVVISTLNNDTDTFNHIFVQVLLPQKDVWISVDGVIRKRPIGSFIKYKRIRVYSV